MPRTIESKARTVRAEAARLASCSLRQREVLAKEESMSRMKLALASLVLLAGLAARADVDKKTERTWKAKCASCHGGDGAGKTEQGAKLGVKDYQSADWQKSKTDDQIRAAIETGVPDKMDPYKDTLDAEQIGKLIELLRSFGK
jgi:mono/diheme cytochrome c family protein